MRSLPVLDDAGKQPEPSNSFPEAASGPSAWRLQMVPGRSGPGRTRPVWPKSSLYTGVAAMSSGNQGRSQGPGRQNGGAGRGARESGPNVGQRFQEGAEQVGQRLSEA